MLLLVLVIVIVYPHHTPSSRPRPAQALPSLDGGFDPEILPSLDGGFDPKFFPPLTGGIEGGESELPLMTNDQWQMTNWIPDLASLVRNDGFDDCDTVSEGVETKLRR